MALITYHYYNDSGSALTTTNYTFKISGEVRSPTPIAEFDTYISSGQIIRKVYSDSTILTSTGSQARLASELAATPTSVDRALSILGTTFYTTGANIPRAEYTVSSDGTAFVSLGIGGATAQASTYIGHGSTRTQIPNTFSSTNKQMMARKWYTWRGDATSSIQVEYPNFYINASFVETGTGADASISAAIEFLDGTIVPFTFSNTAVGTVPTATLLKSDFASIPLMRSGTVFYIRTYVTNTAGIVYYSDANTSISGLPGPLNEAMVVGVTGVANQTTAGTITNTAGSTGQLIFGPTRILASTTRRSFFLLSNSRGAGAYDTLEKHGDMGDIARSIGSRYPYINAGLPSERVYQHFAASHALTFSLVSSVTDVVLGDGINDTRAARTLANMQADLLTIVTAILAVNPAVRIWVQTTPPNPSSSDGFITSTNQTTGTGEAVRVTWNNYLRTTVIANIAGCIDVTSAIETYKDSGKVKYNPDQTNFYVESAGLHCSQPGYRSIAASLVVQQTLGI